MIIVGSISVPHKYPNLSCWFEILPGVFVHMHINIWAKKFKNMKHQVSYQKNPPLVYSCQVFDEDYGSEKIPLCLWVEACNTTVFVHKCSHHLILGMSTPEEAFFGKKLDVYGYTTLMGKVEKVVSWDEGELWHKRLGHLNHRALKVMQQISMRLPKGTLAQIDKCKGCTMGKCEKAMRLSLERELDLHVDEELLVPNDEPQDVE